MRSQGDERTTREILQDSDRKLGTANSLAAMQVGATLGLAALQGQANRYQRQAREQSREANDRLAALQSGQHQANALIASTLRSVEQFTRSVRELHDAVTASNRLIAEQTGQVEAVRDSIDSLRVQNAILHFADWRQTPSGGSRIIARPSGPHESRTG